MKKISLALGVAAIAGLLGLSWYFWGRPQAPPGQPPLLSVTPANLSELQQAFNSTADTTRIVLLLSPT